MTMIKKEHRVDPRSAVPKYYQLSDILRQKIGNAEWQPHDALPPERELETIYGVSRSTVREALNHLENEGLIYREHGRGTFVAYPKPELSLHLLRSFTEDMRVRGSAAGQQILELGHAIPSNQVRQQLELPPEVEQVLRIARLRVAEKEPIAIHVVYLPLLPDQVIAEDELLSFGSLYALLQSKFNLIPLEANQTIEATVASEHEAALLAVTVGSPLLLIERTTFSQQRQPMEYVKMLHRADRYKYYMHMNR